MSRRNRYRVVQGGRILLLSAVKKMVSIHKTNSMSQNEMAVVELRRGESSCGVGVGLSFFQEAPANANRLHASLSLIRPDTFFFVIWDNTLRVCPDERVAVELTTAQKLESSFLNLFKN